MRNFLRDFFTINSDAELDRAQTVLEIAAKIYAFKESQGQVLPDDSGLWSTEGESYCITFNPSQQTFFVEGKNRNPMVVLGFGIQLDKDVVYSVTEADLEQFRKQFRALQNALASSCFPRNQSPAQTQAKAYVRWASDIALA